jgi:glucan 1,3-beta-glucosidase
MWNYKLGLQEGWSPKDPRAAEGYCASIGVSNDDWDGTFQAWQTGGSGAGEDVVIDHPWPPTAMTSVSAAAMTLIPQLTTTGTPVTLPGP